jgi:hypothetical protein
MKTYLSDQNFTYDGSQLRSLFAYTTFKVQGDSLVAWVGPCDIPFSQMKDGEDLVFESPIRGGLMLHFILEKFHLNLIGSVAYQRLLTLIAVEVLRTQTKGQFDFLRDGDDIYLNNKKLSISVATCSPVSALIHFAVNINNQNTPVETLSLEDLSINPAQFASSLLERFKNEVETMEIAASKVFPAQ